MQVAGTAGVGLRTFGAWQQRERPTPHLLRNRRRRSPYPSEDATCVSLWHGRGPRLAGRPTGRRSWTATSRSTGTRTPKRRGRGPLDAGAAWDRPWLRESATCLRLRRDKSVATGLPQPRDPRNDLSRVPRPSGMREGPGPVQSLARRGRAKGRLTGDTVIGSAHLVSLCGKPQIPAPVRRSTRRESVAPVSVNAPDSRARRYTRYGAWPVNSSAGSGNTSWMTRRPPSATCGAHPS